jgi:hypothetical protein
MMIFGFLPQNLKTQTVAVAFSMAWQQAEIECGDRDAPGGGAGGVLGQLAAFRGELYRCFTARADELFELADAVLCAEGPVMTLAGLSLAPRHRRGHGALYDAVNAGRIGVARLRWLRPGAATSPERLFCHVYGRGRGRAQMIPGWPYSVVAALEPGRTSWTAVLDAVRLGPADDETEVAAAQVSEVVARLAAAGHWREGDPAILVVFDAGYDITRMAFLLASLPVELVGRLRSDRALYFPAPPGRCDDSRAARRGTGTNSGSHPENQLFGQATPEPATTLRRPDPPARTRPAPAPKKNRTGS